MAYSGQPQSHYSNYGPSQQERAKSTTGNGLGATFYPGSDDYMMPELSIVSPSPQRVMPEMPVQIADGLERLELEANTPRNTMPPPTAQVQNDSYNSPQLPSKQSPLQSARSRPVSEEQHQSYHQTVEADFPNDHPNSSEPTHTFFPPISNPGPNIPPSFEEKKLLIETARMEVLSSNDPEMQLTWAQDALNHVEIATTHLTRISNSGIRPETPDLERQIKTDAINVVQFLADQHHPKAEFMRGNWLEFGKFGFRMDKKEAFRCYARAAEKGFARAEYRMGMQFENSNEPLKAIKHYTRGAIAGDSASNYRLGMMTLLGQHNQKQDYAEGCRLICQAAEDADENAPQGAYVYGMLLARELPGIDVPEAYLPVDMVLAKEMIEKAALLGFARAQLKLGTAYELCQLGCEFNPALSLHYNALAAQQGEPEAEMAISKWFLCGHEGLFEKNEELAFRYAHRAALTGLGTAEFAIGYFYEIGMFVPVDLKEAQRWYTKAAAHGNKDAHGRIDGISRSKTLSRKDHENVAVSKIRARHGSQRGKNPLVGRRNSGTKASVSSIPEIDMPEPVAPVGNFNYPSNQQIPPPVHRPIQQSIQQQQIQQPIRQHPQLHPIRTNSASLPHTMSYGPHSAVATGPGAGQFGHPGGRPSSAGYGMASRPMSAIHPANRPYTIVSGVPGYIPPAGTYPTGIPPRTTSAVSMLSGPGPNAPYRRPSYVGPPGPTGFGRQSYPAQGGYPPNYPPGPPEGQYGPAQLPNRSSETPRPPVDIGFEAPPPRPQRSPAPRPPKSPTHPGTLGAGPGGRPPVPSRVPSPISSPGTNGRPGAPSATPPANGSYASLPPSPPSQSEFSNASSKQTVLVVSKPPGKGPQTFEAMGVPYQTKEQDCAIM